MKYFQKIPQQKKMIKIYVEQKFNELFLEEEEKSICEL